MKINIKAHSGNYSIYIGKNIAIKLNKFLSLNKIKSNKIVFVQDKNVPNKIVNKIIQTFKTRDVKLIKINFSEKSKTIKTVLKINNLLSKNNFSRKDCLVAIGGGICGDVCGFAASIFKRGLKFVNIPTTLLAQVDSSIGGKTGVNSSTGKNMIGSFYQPNLVISDLVFLDTLNKKQIICGYAEILKHAIIRNRNFLNFLIKNLKEIISKKQIPLKKAIYESCMIKKRIVEKDEKESSLRKSLNFGHTFGHAFESSKKYSKNFNHGEAVILGIFCATMFSFNKKILNEKDLNIIINHLEQIGYNSIKSYVSKNMLNKIVSYMINDKKNIDGKINLILLKRISKPIINRSFSSKEVSLFLKKLVY